MQWYRKALAAALNKEIDWDSDTLKLTLHTSTYAANQAALDTALDTHDYVNDLTDELSTGGNYTSGGFAVTTSAPAYTAANSWATSRANATAYALYDLVRPASANGYLYQAVVAGTSGGSVPTWPTVIGTTVADGGVTWANVGKGVIIIAATDITQGSFTAGPFRYAILSDRTPGTAATQPLIGLIDFVTDRTGGNGTLTLDFSATNGVLQVFP